MINFDQTLSQYLTRTAAPVGVLPLTMACWAFRQTTAAGNLALMHLGLSTGDDSYALRCSAGALSLYAFAQGQGSAVSAISPGTLPIATWFHACGVVGSSTDRRVYLNGGDVGTNASARTPPTLNRTYLGSIAGVSEFMHGWLAEAAIWNEALTDTEAAALGRGLSPILVRPWALRAYWPLGTAHQSGSQARDRWSFDHQLSAVANPSIDERQPPMFYPH